MINPYAFQAADLHGPLPSRVTQAHCENNYDIQQRATRQHAMSFIPFGINTDWTRNPPVHSSYIRYRHQPEIQLGIPRLLAAMRCMAESQHMAHHSRLRQMGLAVSMVNFDRYVPMLSSVQGGNRWYHEDFGNFNADDTKRYPKESYLNLWNETLHTVKEGVNYFTTEMATRGAAESLEQFLVYLANNLLEQSENAIVSGDPVSGGYKIYQVWLVVANVPVGHGYRLSDSLGEFKSNPAVWVPKLKDYCFWACIQRYKFAIEASNETEAAKRRVKVPNKTHCKALAQTCASPLGLQEAEMAGVSLDSTVLMHIAMTLGIDISVINTEQACLFKSNINRNLYENYKEGHCILMLYSEDDEHHWCWVNSFAAAVPSLTCHICKQTFTRSVRLQRHLRVKACLKCDNCDAKMETENEYWTHVNNLAETCPAFQEAMLQDPTAEDTALPFLTPREPPNNAPEKMPDRMMCGDIETLVPIQDDNATTHTGKTHKPYCIAYYEAPYITDVPEARQAEIMQATKDDVRSFYGFNCLGEFLQELRQIRDRVLEESLPYFEDYVIRTADQAEGKAKKELHKRMIRSLLRHFDPILPPFFECPICGCLEDEETGQGFASSENLAAHMRENKNCLYRWYATVKRKNQVDWRHGGSKKDARVLPWYYVYFHNGGKYDYHFLLSAMRRDLSEDDFTVLAHENGQIIQIVLFKMFKFMDSAQVFKGSLRGLGKSFGVDVLKQYWPYKIGREGDLYGRIAWDRIRESDFQTDDKVNGTKVNRCFTAQELIDWKGQWNEPEGLDFRAASLDYLAADVISLHQVVCAGAKTLQDRFRADYRQVCTAPGLALYVYRKEFMRAQSFALLTDLENQVLREAYGGGRNETFVRGLTPAQKQAILEGRAVLHYLDVNSLYPAAQLKPHPGGHPIYYGQRNDEFLAALKGMCYRKCETFDADFFDEVKDYMNEHKRMPDYLFPNEDKYFIIWADWECPQDLKYPILFERMNGKTMFTLTDKTNLACHDPEMCRALEAGYRITKIYKMAIFDKDYPFNEWVERLAREKVRAHEMGDETYRTIIKLLLNSLYGRIAMDKKPSTKLLWQLDRILQIMQKRKTVTKVKPFSYETTATGEQRQWCLVHSVSTDATNYRECNLALGGATTAYARSILGDGFQRVEELNLVEEIAQAFVLYGDTDSMFVYVECYTPEQMAANLDANGDLIRLGDMLHDSEIGKWKNETRGSQIIDAVFPAPKLYFYKTIPMGAPMDTQPTEKGAAKGVILPSNWTPGPCVLEPGTRIAQTINFATIDALVRGEIDGIKTYNELWFMQMFTAMGTVTMPRLISGSYTKRVSYPGSLVTQPFTMSREHLELLGRQDLIGKRDLFLEAAAAQGAYLDDVMEDAFHPDDEVPEDVRQLLGIEEQKAEEQEEDDWEIVGDERFMDDDDDLLLPDDLHQKKRMRLLTDEETEAFFSEMDLLL